MDAIELLKKVCDETSQGIVSKELQVSKTTVNRLLKGNYPNPQKMHKKILDTYGNGSEIIGVESSTSDLGELARELECI